MESDDAALDKADRLTYMIVGSSALAKACFDAFDYALKLRTGEVIRFSEATILSEHWIHLSVSDVNQPKINGLPFNADRGIDVRIADIVWVMDAPEGS